MSGRERTISGLDLARLRACAAEVARVLLAERSEEGVLTLGLVGELGAGKTTFTQAFVGALPGGARLRVTSPTYAIVERHGTRPPVRHVDLYRVGGVDELEAIGYEEMLEEPGFNVVEWARVVPEALPPDWLEIALAVRPDDRRDLVVRAHGSRTDPLLRMKVPNP